MSKFLAAMWPFEKISYLWFYEIFNWLYNIFNASPTPSMWTFTTFSGPPRALKERVQ